MNVSELLSEIDSEISRLQQVRAVLGGTGNHHAPRRVGRPAKKKRTLSAEARAKIAEAQRKRWAKQKKAAK
ncbi:MAG TPA: hypothetical protein VJT08_09940 [Terriglobales bacterium]|nr:hypothetical protein [Terriglobales bacterium]